MCFRKYTAASMDADQGFSGHENAKKKSDI